MATVSAAAVLSMTLTSAGSAWAAGFTQSTKANGNLVLSTNETKTITFDEADIITNGYVSDNVTVDPDNAENKVFKVENASEKDGDGEIWGFIYPEKFLKNVPADKTGTLTFEYKVKFPSGSPKDSNNAYIKAYNRIQDNDSLLITYFGPDRVYVPGTNSTGMVVENKLFDWYTMKEVYDYNTKTVKVFLNDNQVGSEFSYLKKDTNGNYITKDPMKAFVFRGWVPKGFKFYVDDFTVTYNESNEYSPYSKYYFEDFEGGEYDGKILSKWADGTSEIESTTPVGDRKNILKYGNENGNGGLYLDASKWEEQKSRKRGKLTYKFDAYGGSAANFLSADLSSPDDAALSNTPGANNKWGTCWIEFDYENGKIRKYVQHNGKGIETIDMTDTFRSDKYWKMYFRRWKTIGYVDNVEISYLEDLPEITAVTGTKTANSVSATADFDVYAYKDATNMALVGIYEDQKLIAVKTVNADQLTDDKVTCELKDYAVNSEKTYTAKAMFWDMSTAKQLLPLCDTKAAEITTPDANAGE